MLSRILRGGRLEPGTREPVFRHGRGLDPDERRALAAERDLNRAWLAPVEDAAAIGALVLPVLATMKVAATGEAAPFRAAGYAAGLAGIPANAIAEACRLVLVRRGRPLRHLRPDPGRARRARPLDRRGSAGDGDGDRRTVGGAGAAAAAERRGAHPHPRPHRGRSWVEDERHKPTSTRSSPTIIRRLTDAPPRPDGGPTASPPISPTGISRCPRRRREASAP